MKCPCAVYKRGTYPGQVDHPGWLSKVVPTEAALADALAECWQLAMVDPQPAAAPSLDVAPVPSPDSDVQTNAPQPKRGRKPRE